MRTLSADARRTVPEIIQLHQLEPSMREVYVEGVTDQCLIKQYLDDCGVPDVAVLCIDSVNIPFEYFIESKLEDNNRSRVIFLAKILEDNTGRDLISSVVCVADADFDHLLRTKWPYSLLLLTDYSSMELFAWDPSVLDRFVKLVLKAKGIDAAHLLSCLRGPLMEVFLIRAVNQLMGLGIEPIALSKSFRLTKENEVVFDVSEYLNRFLSKGAKLKLKDEVEARIEQLRKQIPPDCRQAIRGHDFFESVAWLLFLRTGAKRTFDLELFGGALLANIACKDFDRTALFTELKQRLTHSLETKL